MRQGTLLAPLMTALGTVIFMIAMAGCPGGDGGIGERCDSHGDCDGTLQCVSDVCVPRCQRAPECGDGYSCGSDGLCRLATGQAGDACTSEVDCAPGLSCQFLPSLDDEGNLLASCTAQNAGRPAGATCTEDSECRNGTCALGHCADLCTHTRDCTASQACMQVPRVTDEIAASPSPAPMFGGCLAAQGNIVFPIEIDGPAQEILLPVPSGAHHASLVFSVEDSTQRVGALSVTSPSGDVVYRACESAVIGTSCSPEEELTQYYENPVRHQPLPGQSVLAMPSTPSVPLEAGAYRVRASTFRPNGTPGAGIPNVTAVVRIDSAVILDVHFHFLDLEDHPCESNTGGMKLDEATAAAEPFFQTEFLGALRGIFARAGIAIGAITYHNVVGHPDLDALDVVDASRLLALGTLADGINVFFVRTLSPVGLQAFGPSPGPAGLGGTRQSGVVIGADTLCYRTWPHLARLTAHEIARYMGLHRNVEPDARFADGIADSDESPNNLMFFSEKGGIDVSPGQADILTRSPVLR